MVDPQEELAKKSTLLKLTGDLLNAIVGSLDQVDLETRKRIIEACGKVCVGEELFGPAIEIAKRISEEEGDIDDVLRRANDEILWCGVWTREGSTISCVCERCGCPLVLNEVVELSGTFCLCSRGWVKAIFETLLKRPVNVELEKARGLGDEECRYVVHYQ